MTKSQKMNTYEALSNLMQHYAMELDTQSKTEMESLLSYCLLGMDTESEKSLTTLFIKALKKKMREDTTQEHFYVKKYEIPQSALVSVFHLQARAQEKSSFSLWNQPIFMETITDWEDATVMSIDKKPKTQFEKDLLRIYFILNKESSK